MICPKQAQRPSKPEDLVSNIIAEVTASSITVELVGSLQEEDRWNKLIQKHHYLKEHRLVGESLRYVIKQNGEWIGLLGWSSAAFHLRPRDAWIGWDHIQRQAGRHLLACNCRFALLKPKGLSPNLASCALSLNLERLSADWQEHYGHPIALVETYVDPKRFEGACYRAASWIEIGLTQGFGRSRLDFYQLHQQPKAIFLYPLVPDARRILSASDMPPAWAPYRREPPPEHYPLSGKQTQSLLDALAPLRDPRRYHGWRHRRVTSILAIAIAAMIAGNNHLIDIGDFAKSLNQNQLRSLRASRCRKTGRFLAPSETTIRRVIQSLDPEQLDSLVNDWLRSHLKSAGIGTLAVDGKAARTAAKILGEGIQLFGALDTQTELFCRQIQIPAKTNEIPTLKDLLRDLDLRGALVSADALNTQTATAKHLVEDKQADYLLVVKANQPKLFDKLLRMSYAPKGVFFPPDITIDQGHGRHETREVYPFEVSPQQCGFPHAAQAALILRTTHHLKDLRVTQEAEIVLSNRPNHLMNAAQLQALRRGHWTIEAVHYVRDVTFGEDASTVHTKHAPQNLAALRNVVIGLCALDGARQHKRASYLPRFRSAARNDRDVAIDLVSRPLLSKE